MEPADAWATRLHALWRVASRAGSTNEFTAELYEGLMSLHGVLSLVGARLAVDDAVLLSRWSDARGVRTDPPGLAADLREWLAANGPRREPGLYDLDLAAVGGRGVAARLAEVGATGLVVAIIELAHGQRGLLGVGTDGPPTGALRAAVQQVSEIVTSADVRISDQRTLDELQVADAILAEASLRMDASLDIGDTMRAVVRTAVPALADAAALHVRGSGRGTRLAVAHVDARQERALARHLGSGSWPVTADAGDEPRPSGLPADAGLATMTTTALRARGRELGVLTFFHRDQPARRTSAAFLRDLAGRAALAIDNATLYGQRRDDVLSLQQHLLPRRLPSVPGVVLAAGYNVADHALEVGGDFYGVVDHGGGAVTALIGDVCGRGAPAAALAGLARHTLESVLGEDRPVPRAVDFLNARMLADEIPRFLTVAAATCVPAGGSALRVESHAAGHLPPMFLRRDGTVTSATCGGKLVGVWPHLGLRAATDTIGLGDCVVLITDGLVEARDDHGRFFGDTELLPTLAALRGLPLPTMVRTLLAGTERYQVNDDAAVLVLRHVGPALLDVTLPAGEVAARVLAALRGRRHHGAELPAELAAFLATADPAGIAVTVHGDETWVRIELTDREGRTAWAEVTA